LHPNAQPLEEAQRQLSLMLQQQEELAPGLYRDLAAIDTVDLETAFGSVLVDRRNVIGDFLRVVGVAHIERAQPGVEPCKEHDALVIDGSGRFIRRMRTVAPAARAEAVEPVELLLEGARRVHRMLRIGAE